MESLYSRFMFDTVCSSKSLSLLTVQIFYYYVMTVLSILAMWMCCLCGSGCLFYVLARQLSVWNNCLKNVPGTTASGGNVYNSATRHSRRCIYLYVKISGWCKLIKVRSALAMKPVEELTAHLNTSIQAKLTPWQPTYNVLHSRGRHAPRGSGTVNRRTTFCGCCPLAFELKGNLVEISF